MLELTPVLMHLRTQMLRAFAKSARLAPGASAVLSLQLTQRDLSTWQPPSPRDLATHAAGSNSTLRFYCAAAPGLEHHVRRRPKTRTHH